MLAAAYYAKKAGGDITVHSGQKRCRRTIFDGPCGTSISSALI